MLGLRFYLYLFKGKRCLKQNSFKKIWGKFNWLTLAKDFRGILFMSSHKTNTDSSENKISIKCWNELDFNKYNFPKISEIFIFKIEDRE